MFIKIINLIGCCLMGFFCIFPSLPISLFCRKDVICIWDETICLTTSYKDVANKRVIVTTKRSPITTLRPRSRAKSGLIFVESEERTWVSRTRVHERGWSKDIFIFLPHHHETFHLSRCREVESLYLRFIDLNRC